MNTCNFPCFLSFNIKYLPSLIPSLRIRYSFMSQNFEILIFYILISLNPLPISLLPCGTHTCRITHTIIPTGIRYVVEPISKPWMSSILFPLLFFLLALDTPHPWFLTHFHSPNVWTKNVNKIWKLTKTKEELVRYYEQLFKSVVRTWVLYL